MLLLLDYNVKVTESYIPCTESVSWTGTRTTDPSTVTITLLIEVIINISIIIRVYY